MQTPMKQCPQCGTITAINSIQCAQCGRVFQSTNPNRTQVIHPPPIYCINPNCKHVIPLVAQFCPNCGAGQLPNQSLSQPSTADISHNSKVTAAVLYGLGFFLPFLCVGTMGFIWFPITVDFSSIFMRFGAWMILNLLGLVFYAASLVMVALLWIKRFQLMTQPQKNFFMWVVIIGAVVCHPLLFVGLFIPLNAARTISLPS